MCRLYILSKWTNIQHKLVFWVDRSGAYKYLFDLTKFSSKQINNYVYKLIKYGKKMLEKYISYFRGYFINFMFTELSSLW